MILSFLGAVLLADKRDRQKLALCSNSLRISYQLPNIPRIMIFLPPVHCLPVSTLAKHLAVGVGKEVAVQTSRQKVTFSSGNRWLELVFIAVHIC